MNKMVSGKRLRAIAMMMLCVPLAACGATIRLGDVPQCYRLVQASGLLEETPPTELPTGAKLPDGHDDARPWQAGFIGQTGQLEKSNVDKGGAARVMRTCEDLHREALAKATRPWWKLF
tara:strand:- start:151 stop:507 length:357 start_codon:yes stop_codon:yes gene_type:complete